MKYRSLRDGSLQIFSDAFQGYYKDRTNGTRDLHFFSAVYIVARIAPFYLLSNALLLVTTVYLMATTITVLLLQPYKEQFAKYNSIDAVMIQSQIMICSHAFHASYFLHIL